MMAISCNIWHTSQNQRWNSCCVQLPSWDPIYISCDQLTWNLGNLRNISSYLRHISCRLTLAINITAFPGLKKYFLHYLAHLMQFRISFLGYKTPFLQSMIWSSNLWLQFMTCFSQTMSGFFKSMVHFLQLKTSFLQYITKDLLDLWPLHENYLQLCCNLWQIYYSFLHVNWIPNCTRILDWWVFQPHF